MAGRVSYDVDPSKLSGEERDALDRGQLDSETYRRLIGRGALSPRTGARRTGSGRRPALPAPNPAAHDGGAAGHPGGCGRPRKYNNEPATVDGVRFDSRLEARRYRELKALEASGEIRALELQRAFEMEVNGVMVCRYVADFTYRDQHGEVVVEDAKGYRTAVYRLKKKLMLAVHGVRVREISRNTAGASAS